MTRRGRGSRTRISLAAALVVAVCAWLVTAASAAANFDDLPGETLNDTPYTSAATFDRTTSVFETSAFTEQEFETKAFTQFLGCGSWGTKTAWVRFATAVRGNLFVEVEAEGFEGDDDLFYKVYEAPNTNPAPADLDETACFDGLKGGRENYSFGHVIPADTVAFVQVLMQCREDEKEESCGLAEREAAPGGPTTVRLRFTPDNEDGDDFPDSIDDCPTEPGPVQGCPDLDGDGIRDRHDACPTLPGPPPNGCPPPVTDADGDGHNTPAFGGGDCNDNNPRIHPGAREIRGNRIDENCDGRKLRFLRVRNEIFAVSAISSLFKRAIGFLKPFKISGRLLRGMVIRLRCQGRGCPFARQAFLVRRKRRGARIGHKLVRRRLAPGARVTVAVTRRGFVGKAKRYRIRRRGDVKVETLCIPPGKTRPRRKKCG